MSGLIVSIYRNAEFGDCSNGGLSAQVSKAMLIDPDNPNMGVFEPKDGEPYLVLVRRDKQGFPPIVRPSNIPEGEHTMFGGNFVFTSDSRFPSDQPIPIHDRVETAFEQRMMSI